MAYPFEIGDPIMASTEALGHFPRWANLGGRIVGRTRDLNIWQVKWDGSNVIKLIHADFLVLTSLLSRRRVAISAAVTVSINR